MKNYGLNLKLEQEQRSDKDWIFGAFSEPCITYIEEGERDKYLPAGEVQKGKEELFDCATRAPINVLETKFNWLYKNNKLHKTNKRWLENNGYVVDGKVVFADAFIAILSGTTREGNSLKAPLDTIRTCGLVPKSKLPLDPEMTFDEYHSPERITLELEQLGQEFKRRFKINYEQVKEIHYKELLTEDLLIVAGYAWDDPIDGEYRRTDKPFNHAFVNYRKPAYFVFDNYRDSYDGDFIKKLSSDYDFLDYGYRVFIPKENIVDTEEVQTESIPTPVLSFWDKLVRWFMEQLAIFKKFYDSHE